MLTAGDAKPYALARRTLVEAVIALQGLSPSAFVIVNYSVIFEMRETLREKSIAWLRFGRQPNRNESSMKTTRKKNSVPDAEGIARRADRGEDVSRFFTNQGRMMPPIQRVNVDFTAPMLSELDKAADELNVSRQAVIKTFLRQALDQRYLAANAGPRPRRSTRAKAL